MTGAWVGGGGAALGGLVLGDHDEKLDGAGVGGIVAGSFVGASEYGVPTVWTTWET